jgi:alkylhydroperoxidase/carboxymuconolactone decarboxylase family protein YurZ
MSITEAARKNHEEMWPDYKSQAMETDPEFIELFDNFAFDEVIGYGNLDTKIRVMMILGSTIACQAQREYKMMVDAALNVGELLTLSMLIALGGTEFQIKGHIQGNVNVGNDKETLLSVMTQLLPYVEYPRTLNALRCLNEAFPD